MKKNIKNSIQDRTSCKTNFSRRLLSSSIGRMPSEILLYIFKYINSYDLLFHVALVCKRWHSLAKEPTLWRSRSLQDEDFPVNCLQLLALAPTLNRVSLHTNFPKDIVVRALLHGSKDLQSLTLHFKEGCLSVAQIKELLPLLPNLRHLDIQLPSVPHDQAIFSAFNSLTKLLSLRLTGFISPVSEMVKTITTRCHFLHTLHLVDCVALLHDEHLQALVADGRPWQSLKLITYFLSEEAYSYFACLMDLKQLALIKCKSLKEDKLLQIAELPCLNSLTITENCILKSGSLVAFFQSQTMMSLRDINLTVYRADDNTALTIATTCIYLVRLRFAMCLLTDAGLESIICNSSGLEDLNLECNIIQGRCLSLIPTHLPNLVLLNLHLCYNITVNLYDLVACLPNLKITDPSGMVITDRSIEFSNHMH